jgi:EGF-like domain/EGF domain
VLCQTEINECSSGPCQHGGVCLDFINLFICVCAAGYRGDRCQLPAVSDPCLPNPCRHEAVCIANQTSTNFGYTCRCPIGYGGLLCDITLDPCISQPCLNSGTCLSSGPTTFTCYCSQDYTGSRCQTPVCLPSSCHNNASCIPTGGGSFRCSCLSGYTGLLCDVVIDPCSSNPCRAGGNCLSLSLAGKSGYGCLCQPGYQGLQCNDSSQVIQSACASCQNGATCVCSSDSNFGTVTCHCVCPEDFTGRGCESPTDACRSSPCHNGGSCSISGPLNDSFVCLCSPGFTGVLCQTDINECLSAPCLNNAVGCSSDAGRFVCSCAAGFTG